MSELISIGVKSIKSGPIPDDGTMGIVLSALGSTYKDSASFKETKQTVFNVDVEESDDPLKQFFTKGAKELLFSLVDYTPETIQAVKGGIVVNGVWQDPDTVSVIELACQIITQTDLLIEIPRLSVSAVFNADLKKGAVALLDVSGTPLKPNGAGVKSVNISRYQNPIVSAGADAAVTVAVHVANLAGTATAYRGSLTYLWTVKSKPVGAAAPVMATPTALNNAVSVLTTIGIYVFTLTSTDSNGYAASDDVTITITA